jgi:hypothetical protein
MGKKKRAKYPYKERMNCFRDLASDLIAVPLVFTPPIKQGSPEEAAEIYCEAYVRQLEHTKAVNETLEYYCTGGYKAGWYGRVK